MTLTQTDYPTTDNRELKQRRRRHLGKRRLKIEVAFLFSFVNG